MWALLPWECGLPARKGKDRRAGCPRPQGKEGNRHPEPTPAYGHPSREGMGGGAGKMPALPGGEEQELFYPLPRGVARRAGVGS